MKYYTAVKMNKLDPYVSTGIDPQNITSNKNSKIYKTILHFVHGYKYVHEEITESWRGRTHTIIPIKVASGERWQQD